MQNDTLQVITGLGRRDTTVLVIDTAWGADEMSVKLVILYKTKNKLRSRPVCNNGPRRFDISEFLASIHGLID